MLGAGGNARSARYAPVGVNLRKSARNLNCVFGANGFTVAATEAGVRASLVAAVKRIVRSAGGVAFILEFVCAVFDAAVAVYNRNCRLFVGELHA